MHRTAAHEIELLRRHLLDRYSFIPALGDERLDRSVRGAVRHKQLVYLPTRPQYFGNGIAAHYNVAHPALFGRLCYT